MHIFLGLRATLTAFSAAIIVALMVSATPAQAYPYCSSNASQYTGSTYACTDCHIGTDGCTSCLNFPCWNAFGEYYATSGWGFAQSYNAWGNGSASTEITTGSGTPGFPNSATNVGCDMLDCAGGASGNTASTHTQSCGNNIVCTSTLNAINYTGACGNSGTAYYYSFAFSCATGTAGTSSGTGAWGCTWCAAHSCSAGYACSEAGRDCVVTNACVAGTDNCNAHATCASTGGSGFSCSCNSGYTGDGVTCSVINECAGNPCNASGDAAATCTSNAPGSLTHTCGCTTGFINNGTTCVGACPAGQTTPGAPCGNGTCATTTPGNWTCSCQAGYVSSGGSNPTCVNYDACIAAATGDCQQTFSGNTCVDQAPPSVTYQCTCGNPAFVNGTGRDGGPACVAQNFCATNHCVDGGDASATCANLALGTVGYSCSCSSALWTPGVVGGVNSCVDKNECTSGTPCGNGTCTNIGAGGGYSCSCKPGYVSTAGDTPTCVHPDACATGGGDSACAVSAAGNTCTSEPAPSTGYACTCGNAKYKTSIDQQECTLLVNNSCASSPCAAGGDQSAICTDQPVPQKGYVCDCDTGFQFDGSTCSAVSGCDSIPNPCGPGGTCSETEIGYTCSCGPGYGSSGGVAPTCAPLTAGNITVTVTPGSCALGGGPTSSPSTWWLLLSAVAALGWRRRRLGLK